MMWLLYYVVQFLLYVVNALRDVVLPLCYVVFFLKQCHFHFRCQTITQALLILKNRLNQFLERYHWAYSSKVRGKAKMAGVRGDIKFVKGA